jgi:stage II sporulation protein D
MRVIFVAFILLLLGSCGYEQVGGPLPVLEILDTETVYEDILTRDIHVEPGKTRDEISDETPGKTPDNPPEIPLMIRVLLNASHFSGFMHGSVAVTATGDFTVSGFSFLGTDLLFTFTAGEVFKIQNADDMLGYNHLYIETNDPEARLEIISLGRNWPNGANPLYRGRIEISSAENGFIVINELPLEEYLYAVVPGEMPSSYGLEAAKVQAITARSFAYRQIYENRFQSYGAYIDDSVISQVYNNIPENDISIEAVRATRGMVLTYEGEVIVANYFSTSGGTTANSGEVWSSGNGFPAETPPYLRARAQFGRGYNVNDLRLEENADAFFRDMDVPAFEREFPFFRWRVRMTADELTAGINRNLVERQRVNPSLIQRVGFGETALGSTVAGIGRLVDLEVTKRGQGGNIMEMQLTGTESTVRVQTEFNIRTLLAPRNSLVFLHNGNTLNGWAMMPSAFFTMEIERDSSGVLTAVTFIGGGHGHGVGMSQNGAKVLLDMGYHYRDVLMHFYPGTEITQINSVSGSE